MATDPVKYEPEEEEELEEATLVSHLIELRQRLMRATGAVLLVFLCLAPFAERVFEVVARPLMSALPENSTMIATQVASPFLTPFKTSLFVALFIAMPAVALPGLGVRGARACTGAKRSSPSRWSPPAFDPVLPAESPSRTSSSSR